MRLAISNIAWDVEEDQAVSKLLGKFAIDAIDVAPGKYFPSPLKTTDKEIASVKQKWTNLGIEITGMQSLLFGTSGLNVFGDDESRDAMLEHLRAICHIGAGVGAERLVFGSPKNRDRSGLSDVEAVDQAVGFFHRVGDIAQESGVLICLEPNPTCYGSNFMTTADETAEIVKLIDHSSICMQLDTGALIINSESPEAVLKNYSGLIGHIHLSEPDLIPLGDSDTDHQLIGRIIARYLPNHIASVEMIATKDEPHILSIERALDRVVLNYRNFGEFS